MRPCRGIRRYPVAEKLPWTFTIGSPPVLGRFVQRSVPPIWVGSAGLIVTVHSPAAET
jgi:hypothetical protein